MYLVESLQDQVKYLREQLDAEREATRENRRLLAAALERIPELEAPPDTPPEPRELPQKSAEEPGKVYFISPGGGHAAPVGGVSSDDLCL